MKSNSPLGRYLTLYKRKKELKEELQDIEDQLRADLPVVQDYLVEAGIDRETIGGHTLALRRTLWVGRQEGVTAGEFAGALRQVPELAQYARESCDTQGLSAFIRGVEQEMEDGHPDAIASLEDLRQMVAARFGPEIAGAMKFTEKYEISVTKSRANTAVKRASTAVKHAARALDDDAIPY